MSGLAESAPAYGRGGYEVFPLRGKVPAIANPHPPGSYQREHCKGECGLDGHGVLDATTDVDRILAWWSARPAANIGDTRTAGRDRR